MNDLKIFNFENNEVRTVEKDNEVFYNIKDIFSTLEIEDIKNIENIFNDFYKDRLGDALFMITDKGEKYGSDIYIYMLIGMFLELKKELSLLRKLKKLDIGYVYVVEDLKNKKVKIGKSKNPLRRVRNVLCAAGAELTDIYITPKVGQYSALERRALNHFKPYKINGEWVSVSFESAIEFIQNNTIKINDVLVIAKDMFEKVSAEMAKNHLIKVLTFV